MEEGCKMEYTVDLLYKTYSEQTVCYTWENGIEV